MAQMDSTGSDATEQALDDRGFFGYTIIMINGTTLVFPLIRKVMTSTQKEMMEKIVNVARSVYKYMCGGQKRLDAKITKRRAERAARIRSLQKVETGVERAARDSTSRSACHTSVTGDLVFVNARPTEVQSSVCQIMTFADDSEAAGLVMPMGELPQGL